MTSYAELTAMAQPILEKLPERPYLGLILGSGLGSLAEMLTDTVRIPYAEIPGMLQSTAPGHQGCLVFGYYAGLPVVCLQGRFHYYEGYDFEQLSLPVHLLKMLGIQVLFLTNAAGGVNPAYHVGDFMLISDHIKFNGPSPLRGKNTEELGSRFFDCTHVYSERLRALARSTAHELKFDEYLREGVYFFMPGPQYETPAEIRAIRILGGDAVGMSTVTESLTAAHCGLEVFACSLITNMAAGILDRPLTEAEVFETAAVAGPRLKVLLEAMIGQLAEEQRGAQ